MELNEHGFFDEFFPLKNDDIYEAFPNELFFNSACNFDPTQTTILPFSDEFSIPLQPNFNYTFNDEFPLPHFNDSSFPIQEDCSMFIMENEEHGFVGYDDVHNLEMHMQDTCKMEPIQSPEVPVFNVAVCLDRKNRTKKLEGQPSKNLMAERRRRKRLNDRLSMLRSIVPKISKMDRTSILGDTIDYMKELLERISNLQQKVEAGSNNMGIFKDLMKPNEILLRNSPKFDVERRNLDTEIEIFCAGKPGLLASTVNTLEALGLEIQNCVISCFNDFAFQASCSEELEGREVISSEDIKQELFRNAGYGGKCL